MNMDDSHQHTSTEGEHLFCPACGTIIPAIEELVEQQRNQIAELQIEVQALQAEITRKIVRNRALTGEQARKVKDGQKRDRLYPVARRVLEDWQERCMPTAREIEAGKRLENCLARLRGGQTEDDLKRAVYGYSLKPYVVANGRRSASGQPDEWRADAELIFRSPQHVQRGMAMADAHDAMTRVLSTPEPQPEQTTPQVQATLAQRIAAYSTSLGFAIFPCKPDRKEPATTHGCKDATREAAQILACWSEHPELNVAVATGKQSGIVVIDIDDHRGGLESLRALERRYGDLPGTLSSVTPSGGSHYYFRHPGENVAILNAVDLVPGVDVRGDGGYVLIPPSKVSGNPYEWDERQAIADLPVWLLRGLQQRNERAPRSADYWVNLARGVTEGQRNNKLTELVGLMVGSNLPDDLVATLALAVNQQFRPPLPNREVGMIVTSIVRRHQRRAAA
jgi:hypothetical protein